jgi:hypothetical protein
MVYFILDTGKEMQHGVYGRNRGIEPGIPDGIASFLISHPTDSKSLKMADAMTAWKQAEGSGNILAKMQTEFTLYAIAQGCTADEPALGVDTVV